LILAEIFNIYCAEGGTEEALPTALQVKVWWSNSTKAEGIGSKEEPFSLAVSCMGDTTRVAISYDRPTNSVEVWQIHETAGGKPTVQRAYHLPGLGLCRVAMTKDGTTLVTQDESVVRVYGLLSDHAELTCTLDAKLGNLSALRYVRPVVSSDGRLAAFVRIGSRLEEPRVIVARIPRGEIVFDANLRANPLAFSPDSKLLAVCKEGTILAYAVGKR
jgi:hypothetical protein